LGKGGETTSEHALRSMGLLALEVGEPNRGTVATHRIIGISFLAQIYVDDLVMLSSVGAGTNS